MKKNILIAMMAAALLQAFAPLSAQEAKTAGGSAGAAGTGSGKSADGLTIRLKGATLGTLFSIVSGKTGLKFTFADPELAEKRITIFIRSTTPGEIMELVTKTKDLEFQRLGSSDNYVVVASTVKFTGYPPLTRKDIADPRLKQLISVRVKGVFLPTFLDILSQQSKLNFVVVGDAQYIPISAYLEKLTVMDVLQFLKTKGLSYSRVGASNTFVVRKLGAGGDEFAEAEKNFGEKKYEEAVKIYERFAEARPASEMADYALLRVAVSYDWIAARDNDAAALKNEEKFLNRLIAEYPKSSRLGDAYLYLGQIYSGYGGAKAGAIDCPKAIRFYELAIQSTYRDWVKAQAQVRIGQCYEYAGDKAKARETYADAARKYPNEDIVKALKPEADEQQKLLNAGEALENAGEYDLAAKVYEKLLAKSPAADMAKEAERRLALCKSRAK